MQNSLFRGNVCFLLVSNAEKVGGCQVMRMYDITVETETFCSTAREN